MKKTFSISFIGFLSLPLLIFAATDMWVGTTPILNDPANWYPNLPGAQDTGFFGTEGNHTPTLISPPSNPTFSPGGLTFIDQVNPYTITMNGGASISTLSFSGSGVTNSTPLTQNFMLIGDDNIINFYGNSSADVAATGKVNYNMTGVPSDIRFYDTSKGSNANFNLINTTTNSYENLNSLYIHLMDSAATESAKITLSTSALIFFNNSIAGSTSQGFQTIINALQGSFIQFANSSDPSNSIINLHNTSILQFATSGTVTKGGPLITMFDSSTINVTDSVVVGSLKSSSANTIVNIPLDQNFTTQEKAGVHDVYAGAFAGDGNLIVAGANNTSSLKLTGNSSTFTGTTIVQSGKLILDGILGGNFNVFNILKGTGIARGIVDVKNGGVISPGHNNIGTLTVGNYKNEKKGIYRVDINGRGDSDLIHATPVGTTGTGSANILGGTVEVDSTNGSYLIGVPYTIVTADGGRTGKYTKAITNLSPFLIPKLTYDPNHVFLILTSNFKNGAKTYNQKQVAQQIDNIVNPSRAQEIFLQTLLTLSPSQVTNVFDQLSGEQYASIFPTFQKANERFIHGLNLPHRFSFCDCELNSHECYEIWGDIQYGRSYISSDRNAKGYKGQNINAFISTQMKLNSCTNLGAAVYYENDILRFNLNGKSRTNTVLGSLFALYQGSNYYLLTDLIGGYSHCNFRRHINFGDFNLLTRSHPRAYNATLYGEFGVDYCCQCIAIQPFFGLEGGYYTLNEVNENGGAILGLKLKNHSHGSFDQFLGFRAKGTLVGGLEIIVEAAWQHRYNTAGNQVKLMFQEFGQDFIIKGPKQDRNGVEGSLICALDVCDTMKIYSEVYGEKWNNYCNYSIALGLDITW